MSIPVVLSWSGGKDCALTLAELQASDQYEVVSLLTTFTRKFERVSMHGIQRELILQQAEQLGLPLAEAWINHGDANPAYEESLSAALQEFKEEGVETVAFGDLFLEDIRNYRDALVQRVEMKSLYPIWGEETFLLAHQFIADGFKAISCCVDSQQIPASFCGREFNQTFLQSLPNSADPCGENGEFHTFVYDCPLMSAPIEIEVGEVHRDGQFVFRDLKSPVHSELTSSGETR